MKPPRRRSDPARPFVVSLFVLLGLVGLSLLIQASQDNGLASTGQLLTRRGLDIRGDDSKECREVHRAKDQCAFVRSNCEEEDSGLFSYLTLYYCDLPQLKPLAFTIIVLWACLLFSTIGIAASDFFCVNLSTISNILGMSESMAGVTFLAFGNGSPDVFSTFAAMKSNSGSLALGELYGAAGFITAVVAGSMAIVRPFKVARRSFVRDIVFFIIAIGFSMVFLSNGELSVWECAAMVGFYIFYVGSVVLWHWWLNRRRRRRERNAAVRGHFVLPTGEELATEENYVNEDAAIAGIRNTRSISADDFDALEQVGYRDGPSIDELEEEQVRDKWLGEISSNMRITMPPDGERRPVFNPIRPSLVGALEFRAVLNQLQKFRSLQPLPIHMRRYSDTPYYINDQETNDGDVDSRAGESTSLLGAPANHQGLTPGRLAAHHRAMAVGGRSRAVSANDASGLDYNPSTWRLTDSATIPQVGILSASPPDMEEDEIHDNASHVTFSDRGSVDKAHTDTDHLLPKSNTQVHAQNMLAPPPNPEFGGGRRSSQRSSQTSDYFSARQQQQMMKPWPPRISLPGTSLSSPTHSPRLLHRDHSFTSTVITSAPSLSLPPPTASSESNDDYADDITYKPPRWWPSNILPPPPIIARILFPTVYGWREKTIWEKLLGAAAAPSFFFLTITLPIVDPVKGTEAEKTVDPTSSQATAQASPARTTPGSKKSASPATGAVGYGSTARAAVIIENENATQDQLETETAGHAPEHTAEATSTPKAWSRWLVLVHCFTSPMFVIVLVWANSPSPLRAFVKPALYSLLGSFIASSLILFTTTPFHPPRWHLLLCFVGFAVSVTWISTIAEEVVGVLKAIGVIFNISDAILGLTIFAVGNSLGDLVADITVARLGYPVMALSACFGGPMLNILLGIGLSGLYVTIHGAQKRHHKHPDRKLTFEPYPVEIGPTLVISAISLLVTLAGLLIVVPLNKWRMDRKIGWGLVVVWCASTILNAAVEVTGVFDDMFTHRIA